MNEQNTNEDNVDEESIKLMLLEDGEKYEEGLNMLIRTYKNLLFRECKRNASLLPSQDYAEIVQQVFIEIHNMVQKGNFDPDKSLIALLLTIVRRRTIDICRKQNRLPIFIYDDDTHAKLIDTRAPNQLDGILKNEEAAEVRNLFKEFIARLPLLQRRVAQVMKDNFPDSISRIDIQQKIAKRWAPPPPPPTVMNVKSALQVIRNKFRNILKEKGINHE